jgi:alpha-glucosidase
MSPASPRHRWWEGAVLYQCYPRSFADATGDGIGDLEGIRRHLDHLAGAEGALGVDALWLSPIYPHGGIDGGYDVINHTSVASEFGSLRDFDRLLDEAHRRGLRVLLDLVAGHVSDQHPWFREARASRTAPRRHWFIWADPRPGGKPPTNWVAIFGGPAWTFDPATGQYYHHTYYPEQPDLNWRNPEVQAAMADILRFWLDRGVDGFRVDAAENLVKDDRLRDNPLAHSRPGSFPPDPGGFTRRWNSHLPGARSVLHGFRRATDERPDAFLLGEIYAPPSRLASYLTAGKRPGLHTALDMELALAAWDAAAFRRAIGRAERHLAPPRFPTWNLSNHDVSRQASRWGPQRTRLAALILLTLRGAVCLYQGEEIGMTDHPSVPQPMIDRWGRDPARTPMQWTATPGAGFTTATPWLPLHDPTQTNVASQRADPDSLLSLYRRLIRLRRRNRAIRHGALKLVPGLGRGVLAYVRSDGRRRVLVLANMGPAEVRLAGARGRGTVLAATGDRSGTLDLQRVQLAPLEGIAIEPRSGVNIG